ncbi:MAG TPA: iron ABC transporter substrate-binding protein, partial [Alphaproteobacteria bacterium]|nr:iron ABC transporter substrate-binding protein [Alphaproteobacteria bacterium]
MYSLIATPRLAVAAAGFAAIVALAPTAANAQGNLVLYCTPEEQWCRAVVTAFEKETGIKVAMTRKSSGE